MSENAGVTSGNSFAGDVELNELQIISLNKSYDIQPYFMELNLYEDMFSPSMSGEIVVADPIGMMKNLPIIGEEYLTLDFNTSGMEAKIRKTFRIYKVEKRSFQESDRVQTYVIHFSAVGVFLDSINKIYKTYSGSVDIIADKVYRDYIQTPKSIDTVYDTDGSVKSIVESKVQNEMISMSKATNEVKFNTNGWGGIKTLSWLASKMIASETKTADVLFFETSQNHYLASISEIIKYYKDNKVIAGDYYMIPKNMRGLEITGNPIISGSEYSPPSIGREYKIVESMEIIDNFDTLALTRNGFYASRQIQFDIINKRYKFNDYDYIEKFKDYPHLEEKPIFTNVQYRDPKERTTIEYSHPRLYTGIIGNANERIGEISQNRNSILTAFANYYRLAISVPGRTDLEAGSVIYFQMPDTGNKGQEDKVISSDNVDNIDSGLYMITSIRHKITQTRYMQTLEIVKDSNRSDYK